MNKKVADYLNEAANKKKTKGKLLTIKTAKTAKVIRNIQHPEWGTKKFNYNDQPLPNGDVCSSFGSGSDSAVLFEKDYKFWEVVA